MNSRTLKFMDKQIMDLSNLKGSRDSVDHMNPEAEIVPSYDFQPIRPTETLSSSLQPPSDVDSSKLGDTIRAWKSADSNSAIPIRNYGFHHSVGPSEDIVEKEREFSDTAFLSEIDRIMKKHADSLLNACEGVSAQLSQLESKTQHLENSVDNLKASIGNNHGADAKMRQVEDILREVQDGVQVIKDKQEIMEAHLQFAKLQVSKGEQQGGAQNTGHMDSVLQAVSATQQQLAPAALAQPPPVVPPPSVPPTYLSEQNLLSTAHLPKQFPQAQAPSVPHHESYFPLPGQRPEIPSQQHYYQMPPPQDFQTPPVPPQQLQPSQPAQPQQLQPSPLVPPPQHYQPSLHSYTQLPPLPQQPLLPGVGSPQPQPQPQLGHHPEEASYIPSQNYPPGIRQRPPYPSSGAPPSQQLYGNPSHMYDPPSSRPGPGFSGSYVPSSSGPGENYNYSGPPSQYGSGSPLKQLQFQSSAMSQSGGSSYAQLPTAQTLAHAIPTASVVGDGPGSAGTGNRVPVDDVIDKVTNMGFPREQVRATVKKLTESGQSVDLNVVLDKLMNDGDGQLPRGWFGR